MTPDVASFDEDLFTDEAIAKPYPRYKTIRDLGPAVWLTRYDVWALSRYQDVRNALRQDEALISGKGVALNDFMNAQASRITLISDGDLHRQRRSVLIRPMMPAALKAVRQQIDRLSDELVDDLLLRDRFDGIADFARFLPLAVVAHLVGLPDAGRERMLDWAAATFNALGPMNARAQAAGPALIEMFTYAAKLSRNQLRPDGWAAAVYQAAEDGRLDPEDASGLIVDYVAPSLDTTILGAGHMLYLLGSHPEEYQKVRSDPSLIPSAVHEALRVGSPVRAFSRLVASAYQADEVVIPEGDRVVILYGAANHDERHYPDPERFDVARNPRDHLAFGHGVHRCAGGHLAQLEMESLLRALVDKVTHIAVGEPEPLLSNMLSGHARFAASFS